MQSWRAKTASEIWRKRRNGSRPGHLQREPYGGWHAHHRSQHSACGHGPL